MSDDKKTEAITFEWFGQKHVLFYQSTSGTGRPYTLATPADLAAAGYVPASQLAEVTSQLDTCAHLLEVEKREHEETRGYRQHAESLLTEATAKLDQWKTRAEIEDQSRAAWADRAQSLETALQYKLQDIEQRADHEKILLSQLAEATAKLEAANAANAANAGLREELSDAHRELADVESLRVAGRQRSGRSATN